VPSRATTIDSDFGNEGGLRALLGRALGRNPLDVIGIVILLVAAGAVLINALYRQPGPHPSPIFSVKPRPVAAEPAEIVPPLPRARPAAAVAPKHEPAAAVARPEPVEARPAPSKQEAAPRPAARPDPINVVLSGVPAAQVAAHLPPVHSAARVTAVQRELNDFGYGPVKPTGANGSATAAAIQKFERDRRMPLTGQISPRLLQELSKLTGKPIE
jgi:hypothetical protein